MGSSGTLRRSKISSEKSKTPQNVRQKNPRESLKDLEEGSFGSLGDVSEQWFDILKDFFFLMNWTIKSTDGPDIQLKQYELRIFIIDSS